MNRANIKGGFGSATITYEGEGVSTDTQVSAPSRDKSPEGKASNAMMKAMNVLDFSPSSFVYPIATAPLALRRRFLVCIYVLFRSWSHKYDDAAWEDDEEMAFLIDVKRIQEALDPYFGR